MSATRRVLVIGSGQRVQQAALPVIVRARGDFELEGIVSRRAKEIESEGKVHRVDGLETITDERLRAVDLLYMVVTKPAVPSMLARLARHDLSRVDLLIETPVMLFRHLGQLKRLEAFRNVWVSEDCSTLPCFDPVRSPAMVERIGELERVRFDRSAYAYHGLAMTRTLLGGGAIRRGVEKGQERHVIMANGREARIVGPRDYSLGTMELASAGGTVTDVPGARNETLLLEPILERDNCVGFRAGEVDCRLDDEEVSLIGERAEGVGVTAWMDGMKRVGFLRLLRASHAGEGAYPLADAVEDAVVDYHLGKLGRYRKTPFTDPGSGLARLSYALLTALAGGRVEPSE